jgi:hypothetical protein
MSRWIVWSPLVVAVLVLAVEVASANLAYPLLATDEEEGIAMFAVGAAVWYGVFLGGLTLVRAVVDWGAIQPLETRAGAAAILTGVLLVASMSTSSSGGYISIRNDALVFGIPGIVLFRAAEAVSFRSPASREATRGDVLRWGRRGWRFRRLGDAQFWPDGRLLLVVTDAIPHDQDRPTFSRLVALDAEGVIDRAFSRACGGDPGGSPVLAGDRIVVVQHDPLGVTVLRADGQGDAAATAALSAALAQAGVTELRTIPVDADGRRLLATTAREAPLTLVNAGHDPTSVQAFGAPPRGFDRHVAMGERLVSANLVDEPMPSLGELARERLITSDGVPLEVDVPSPLIDPGAPVEASVAGLFPWTDSSVLVALRIRQGKRRSWRRVLAIAAPAGSSAPALAAELAADPVRAVRLEDGALAVQEGRDRVSIVPATGVHRLEQMNAREPTRARFRAEGGRATWDVPGGVWAISPRGEILTCREGIPVVLYREGAIGTFNPPLPFGC